MMKAIRFRIILILAAFGALFVFLTWIDSKDRKDKMLANCEQIREEKPRIDGASEDGNERVSIAIELPLDSFARTVKSAPSSLPECTSGNEFLSPVGGRWEKSELSKNKTLYQDHNLEKKRLQCYSDDYDDTSAWVPNCTVPTSVLENHFETPIKVLLVGDSLTIQIETAASWNLIGAEAIGSAIEFKRQIWFNPMLSSVHYESDLCTDCQTRMEDEIDNLDMVLLSEEEFIEALSGYDYIFYNEYAHYVGAGFMSKKIPSFFEEQVGPDGYSMKEVVKDTLSYFERQLQRKAELMRSHLPSTKVYYRTSPPHAYDVILGPIGPKGEPLPNPVKKTTLQECEEQILDYNGVMCYSVLNDIGRSVFTSFGHGTLETGPAMSQRTDAHPCSVEGNLRPDCLHYCMPGPPNVMLAGIVVEVLAKQKEQERSIHL